jgi:hypothetical protein
MEDSLWRFGSGFGRMPVDGSAGSLQPAASATRTLRCHRKAASMSPDGPPSTTTLKGIAELAVEARALGEAALVSDWDEARFRSLRITAQALDLGASSVVQTANDLFVRLGPAGSQPDADYGATMVLLADAISALARVNSTPASDRPLRRA